MSDTRLYTMLLRDRDTGREEELYGYTTENVIAQFGVPNLDEPRFGDGNWELVVRTLYNLAERASMTLHVYDKLEQGTDRRPLTW